MHIHCFYSLIKYCDIPFRFEHNYYKTHYNAIVRKFPFLAKYLINGRGVSITVYSDTEIYKVIKTSKEILENELDVKVSGIRFGGWLTNDNALKMLSRLGFSYDSSATPPEVLSQGYSFKNKGNKLDEHGDDNGVFTDYVSDLWGANQASGFLMNKEIRKYFKNDFINKTSMPFKLFDIIKMPNNASMADFISIEKTVNRVLETENNDVYFNIGCHQEGSVGYKDILRKVIKLLIEKGFVFKTVRDSINAFL